MIYLELLYQYLFSYYYSISVSENVVNLNSFFQATDCPIGLNPM